MTRGEFLRRWVLSSEAPRAGRLLCVTSHLVLCCFVYRGHSYVCGMFFRFFFSCHRARSYRKDILLGICVHATQAFLWFWFSPLRCVFFSEGRFSSNAKGRAEGVRGRVGNLDKIAGHTLIIDATRVFDVYLRGESSFVLFCFLVACTVVPPIRRSNTNVAHDRGPPPPPPLSISSPAGKTDGK